LLDKSTSQRASWSCCRRQRVPGDVDFEAMHPLKAHVHNGHLVVDEPTDLPEGEVVYLQLVEGILAGGPDDLDNDERGRLHSELDASIAEADAGDTDDFGRVVAELRQRL
jgi:hypothetical protein